MRSSPLSRRPRSAASRPVDECKDIDERINAFLDAARRRKTVPLVRLRQSQVTRRRPFISAAAIIAVAVSSHGRHQIVGLDIGRSEAEPF
jgi:hypothetical protein